MPEKVTHPSGWTLMSDEQMQSFLNGYWSPKNVIETEEGIWYVDEFRRRSAIPPQLSIVKEETK